jgi:Protein of unknown function (DUF2726)
MTHNLASLAHRGMRCASGLASATISRLPQVVRDRRRPLRSNAYEVLTADLLAGAAEAAGSFVTEKVRIADALEIGESGLTDEEYSYALKAHFDFVVVTGEEHTALFAVEFDGPSHDTADGQRRDALKDAICAKLGMPLLRIREEHLLGIGHEPILAWLVTAWFLAAAFEPVTGEPFNFRLTMTEPKEGRAHLFTFVPEARGRIFDLLVRDAGGGQEVQDAVGRRRVTIWFPYVAIHDDPEGTGYAQGYAFLRLQNGTGLVGRSRCRAVRFGPIRPGDIAGELALLDLAEQIESLELGQVDRSDVLLSAHEVEALLAATTDWDTYPIFIPQLPI